MPLIVLKVLLNKWIDLVSFHDTIPQGFLLKTIHFISLPGGVENDKGRVG